MTVTLRAFEAADHAQALALWRRTPGVGLSESDTPAAIEAFLHRNPGLSLVAEQAGVMVGTLLCGHDGRRGLIYHLVVDVPQRRTGLATRLLDQALQGLRGQGITKAHLMVFRHNAPGLAFWQRVAAERTELALFSVAVQTPPAAAPLRPGARSS